MLATKIVSEDGISYNLTPLGYVVLIAVVIVVLAVGFIVKDKKTHSVKRLVTSAMAIALATLTSFITIFKMPMGGSVTLFSMLFIVLIGYWYYSLLLIHILSVCHRCFLTISLHLVR